VRFKAGRTATCVGALAALAMAIPGGASAAGISVKPACTIGPVRCLALVRTDIDAVPLAQAAHDGYGPADLRSAYKLTSAASNGGAGQTVAIVDAYDDPNAEADLAVYRSYYGLPACTTANGCFRKLNQDGEQGNYSLPNPDWELEESLDLDMVSATCPKCHIMLVEANSADETAAAGTPGHAQRPRRGRRHRRQSRRHRGLQQLRLGRPGEQLHGVGPLLQPSQRCDHGKRR
jgi:hypothetical protein